MSLISSIQVSSSSPPSSESFHPDKFIIPDLCHIVLLYTGSPEAVTSLGGQAHYYKDLRKQYTEAPILASYVERISDLLTDEKFCKRVAEAVRGQAALRGLSEEVLNPQNNYAYFDCEIIAEKEQTLRYDKELCRVFKDIRMRISENGNPPVVAEESANQAEIIRAWMQNNSHLLANIFVLNLRKKELTHLPPEVKYLTQLQKLDLSENQLREISIPSELAQLQELYLPCNKLRKISISPALTRLQKLYLPCNKLRKISIPAALTQLQILTLSWNQLTEISIPPAFNGKLFFYNNPEGVKVVRVE